MLETENNPLYKKMQELQGALGPCKYCGGAGKMFIYPMKDFPNGKVHVCCVGPCTDGGPTYCGCRLDGVLDEEALELTVQRWNGALNQPTL